MYITASNQKEKNFRVVRYVKLKETKRKQPYKNVKNNCNI